LWLGSLSLAASCQVPLGCRSFSLSSSSVLCYASAAWCFWASRMMCLTSHGGTAEIISTRKHPTKTATLFLSQWTMMLPLIGLCVSHPCHRAKLVLPTVASLPLLIVYYLNHGSTTVMVPVPLRFVCGVSVNLGTRFCAHFFAFSVCLHSSGGLLG
jgi:hypothetical protein